MSYSTLPSMQKTRKSHKNLLWWVGEHDLNKNPSIKKSFSNKRRARGLKGLSPFSFKSEYSIFGCNAEMA